MEDDDAFLTEGFDVVVQQLLDADDMLEVASCLLLGSEVLLWINRLRGYVDKDGPFRVNTSHQKVHPVTRMPVWLLLFHLDE